MKTISNLDSAENLIKNGTMTLLYISRPDCGVCTAIRPKVEEMLERYPEIESGYIDLDQVTEAAGRFMVFTIPAIIVYAEAKEVVREARYISIDELEEKIARPYGFLFSDRQ